MSRPKHHVFVCRHVRSAGHPRGSCGAHENDELIAELARHLMARGLFGQVAVTACSCLGPCEQGPNVLVYPAGVLYSRVRTEDVDELIDDHFLNDRVVERLCAPDNVW